MPSARRAPEEADSVGASSRRPIGWWWAQALLIVLVVGWRSVSLGADPPTDFIPTDVGFQIDEGYKTLSPRNLVLFGATHWNPEDRYAGWMRHSPITQWPYYLAFRALGVSHRSARVVSVVFFAALLVAAAVFLNARGSPALAFLGVVLLGSDMGLFHFSRVALLEVPLCVVLYGGIFLANSLPRERRFAHVAVLLITAVVAALGVKATALLYLAPPLTLLVLSEIMGEGALGRTKVVILGTALPVGLFFLYETATVWQRRLDLEGAVATPSSVVFHPTYLLSPLAVSLAYVAFLDIFMRSGLRAFRENRYLLTLTAMALFVPAVLPAFRYAPPRYFLPIVPAALLAVVEWWRLHRAGMLDGPYRLSPVRVAVGALVLLPLTASLVGFAGAHVVSALPFLPQGQDPGIDLTTLVKLYPVALVLVAAAAVVVARGPKLQGAVPAVLIMGMIGQILFSARSDLGAVVEARRATDEIADSLAGTVAEGESVGGDWAPYFALGTSIPALYMTRDWNAADRVEALRPTYFLDSSTVWDRRTLAGIRERPGVTLGAPVRLGSYFGHEIRLFRVAYSPGS